MIKICNLEYVNKLKVFNDPVHGFISIPSELIFDIIQHPIFQRLRRICQTGLTELVYPGAKHSRFHHALGAMYLTEKAVEVLRAKNIEITEKEKNAVLCAILLHDVGHGPFSHTLENTLIEDLYHEKISLFLMEKLNAEFSGELDLAIKIFKGEYEKHFLTQLVSSQLDMDRLDYLKRDSFFTGVVEGNINPERIISTLNVKDDLLVVDSKGIYSIEKYLAARMFMYWQVYNHRTSFSAEVLLTQAFRRAKEISRNGGKVFATDALGYFLENETKDSLKNQLDQFIKLDDSDVWASLKQWQYQDDIVLSYLSRCIINRKLPVSKIFNEPVSAQKLKELEEEAISYFGVEDASYFVHQSHIKVTPYDNTHSPIFIMNKDRTLQEISVSPMRILSQHLLNPIEKFHLCYLDVKKKI